MTQTKLKSDPLIVRIHSQIVQGRPWARLWYLLRANDTSGRGIVSISIGEIWWLLEASQSTVYEWLRDGRKAGAFRKYRITKGNLTVWLGGLHKVCQKLGLQSWGTVAEVPLTEVLALTSLRAVATAATTQERQHQSFIAARRSLNERERQYYQISDAITILNQAGQSSLKPDKGQVPCLIWVGGKRIFVSKGFIPFGASQSAIAKELGCSERTLRRHLSGVTRRQLVQSKNAYTLIESALKWDAERYYLSEENIGYKVCSDGEMRLHEPNGNSSAVRRQGHLIHKERFFSYAGKTWMYRCNLYQLDMTLASTRTSRNRYKLLIRRNSGRGRRSLQENDKSFLSEKSLEKELAYREK